MRLVVIDLIPALLSWEGRDRSKEPSVAPDAAAALGEMFVRFRIAGVVDAAAEATGSEMRDHLARSDLAEFFDMVGTTAEFGPQISPRVIRRLIRALGGPDDRTLLITGRHQVLDQFARSRIPVIFTTMDEFSAVPDAVEALLGGGRVNP